MEVTDEARVLPDICMAILVRVEIRRRRGGEFIMDEGTLGTVME